MQNGYTFSGEIINEYSIGFLTIVMFWSVLFC